MRKLLCLLGSLYLTAQHGQQQLMIAAKIAAGASISVVNTAVGNDATGASLSLIAAAATSHTTGNLLVVGCRISANITLTVSDTAGNTYTALTPQSGTPGVWQWFYAANITGNVANVVTCTNSSTSAYRSIIVYQVAGASTSTPFDTGTDVGSCATTATPTSPSFSTSVANSIIFFGSNVGNLGITWTAGNIGGVVADAILPSAGTNPVAAAEYRIVSATQTSITAAMSSGSSENHCSGAAVFK